MFNHEIDSNNFNKIKHNLKQNSKGTTVYESKIQFKFLQRKKLIFI